MATTAHDLAADWGWMNVHEGFRVLPKGRVVWERAEYAERDDKVRVQRIVRANFGRLELRQRWVDPDTPVELVGEAGHFDFYGNWVPAGAETA